MVIHWGLTGLPRDHQLTSKVSHYTHVVTVLGVKGTDFLVHCHYGEYR